MSISKDILVDALRIRYDAHSSETIFELACSRAGLEGKTSFEQKEVAAFRAALEKVGDRVGGVLARIDDLAGTAPAKSDGKPEAKAEAKSDSAKSDSKPNDSKPDGKPNDAKSDGKPEPKGEAKSDGKPEPKGEAKSDSKPTKADAKSDSKSNEAKGEAKGEAKADAKTKGEGKPVETTIVLRGVDAKDDEQVMLCGALSELGDWDPERARPMVREGDQWLATLKLAPDAEIAFKFLRKNAAGAITWEAGDNRQVRGSERLDVTWRTA